MKLSSIVRALTFCVVAACGGSDGTDTGECVDLCTEAQAGDCTSIEGNCSAFCDALDGVQDEANCTSQRASYQSCLADGVDVCDNDCGVEETTLSNCLANYCLTRADEPDCATLINSF